MCTIAFDSLFRFRPAARLFAAAMVLLGLTGGCSFLKPAVSESHYYLLTAVGTSGAAAGDQDNARSRLVLRILPVELADYLKTKDMAVRTGTNEVTFAMFHRWAEPLDAGIRRVLAEDLRSSPAVSSVLTDQTSPTRGPVYDVSIHVLSFEGRHTSNGGSAVFKAAWEITRSGSTESPLAQGVFRAKPARWNPGEYGALADNLSQALSEFSHVLVSAISSRPNSTSPR